jgi:hypothetical protein
MLDYPKKLFRDKNSSLFYNKIRDEPKTCFDINTKWSKLYNCLFFTVCGTNKLKRLSLETSVTR